MSKDVLYQKLNTTVSAAGNLYNEAKAIIYEQEIELNKCKEYLHLALDYFDSIPSCKYARCEHCLYHVETISDHVCPDEVVFKWKYADDVMKLLGCEDNDK